MCKWSSAIIDNSVSFPVAKNDGWHLNGSKKNFTHGKVKKPKIKNESTDKPVSSRS